MTHRSDRRHLILGSGAGLVLAATHVTGHAAYRQTPPASGDAVGPPAWYFSVHEVQDPYAGTMQAPAAAPAGTRFVAIDVEIVNDADQALSFTPVEVRLRDAAGTDYRGGSAIGTEPLIGQRNLNPGERSRGWIWFIVPVDAQLLEIVYVAPAPQYRLPFSG